VQLFPGEGYATKVESLVQYLEHAHTGFLLSLENSPEGKSLGNGFAQITFCFAKNKFLFL